jgi:hypothetical protein
VLKVERLASDAATRDPETKFRPADPEPVLSVGG